MCDFFFVVTHIYVIVTIIINYVLIVIVLV